MMIHEITRSAARRKKSKPRVGRGQGTGSGKTAGRGTKGAASRSGWSRRYGYEGGQVPLIRRIPKRGFSNVQFAERYHVVNVKELEARFADGEQVTVETLAKAGVVRDGKLPLKVLGEGDLTRKLTVTAAKFSASARAKIEAAGGSAVVVTKTTWKRARTPKPASA